MADLQRVEGISPSQLPASRDIRQMANQLKKEIDEFNQLIPPSPEQLNNFAKSIQKLHQTSQQALKDTAQPSNLLMEDVQDSAETVQTILQQELQLEENGKNISLVAAAKNHQDSQGTDSDLLMISHAFVKYPDQTQALKTELTLTSRDLDQTK